MNIRVRPFSPYSTSKAGSARWAQQTILLGAHGWFSAQLRHWPHCQGRRRSQQAWLMAVIASQICPR